jgi:putative Mg2+ transporter-C (MgtC) family protein
VVAEEELVGALVASWPWEVSGRLLLATILGTLIGLNRDLKGKPAGLRTMALVALGAAVIGLAALHTEGVGDSPHALARVVQGVVQGVMAGVGVFAAGVVIRGRQASDVHNLTTAAAVWVTAALGAACALAPYPIILTGAVLAFVILLLGGPLGDLLVRRRRPSDRSAE